MIIICIYIYIYTHTHTHIYIYIYIHIHTYIRGSGSRGHAGISGGARILGTHAPTHPYLNKIERIVYPCNKHGTIGLIMGKTHYLKKYLRAEVDGRTNGELNEARGVTSSRRDLSPTGHCRARTTLARARCRAGGRDKADDSLPDREVPLAAEGVRSGPNPRRWCLTPNGHGPDLNPSRFSLPLTTLTAHTNCKM